MTKAFSIFAALSHLVLEVLTLKTLFSFSINSINLHFTYERECSKAKGEIKRVCGGAYNF